MKLAKWILFSAMCFSINANAITFCTNATGINKSQGGANWLLLLHDNCPKDLVRIQSMHRFGYKLINTGTKSCVYNSPRTEKSGDTLICETKLTREQAAVKIRKSGITSSGLLRHAARLETPVEELEFHDEEELAAKPGLPAPPPAAPVTVR